VVPPPTRRKGLDRIRRASSIERFGEDAYLEARLRQHDTDAAIIDGNRPPGIGNGSKKRPGDMMFDNISPYIAIPGAIASAIGIIAELLNYT